MKNITLTILSIFLCLFLTKAYAQNQNINVLGLGNTIPDSTPGPQSALVSDDTDFGSVLIGNNDINTFTIENTYSTGNPSNNILTISSITLSGADASQFSITNSITTINRGSTATFTITFTPTSGGVKNALVTIVNNSVGANEQPYTFNIRGTGVVPVPEINLVGNSVNNYQW